MLLPQWRPSFARVPCDARCEWGPLNSFRSLALSTLRHAAALIHSPLRFSAPLRGLETVAVRACIDLGCSPSRVRGEVSIESESPELVLEDRLKRPGLLGAGWLLTFAAVSAAGGADRLAARGPSQRLSAGSEATGASSTDPASREHRRAPGRRPGGDVRAALLVTFVATKVTRISWRSQRRNAFDLKNPSDNRSAGIAYPNGSI